VKTRVDDLAILGGQPAFTTPLHVGRPNIGNRERLRERMDDLLDRRWLTNDGLYVKEFEERIAATIGVKHCIATCNATSGLEILLRAARVTGEVILPSFTFVATAHAVEWMGATPVFCDVTPDTHTLDPDKVEALITPRTAAVLGVHLWGQACQVDALSEITARRGIRLFFDAAHAFGCSNRGRMIGGFGDAEVFSFHATKFVNAFEGGAIVTNSDELAHRAQLMRNFGFVDYDRVESVGTNAKMTEASAAMGLTSIESLDEFIRVNRRNLKAYAAGISGVPGVALLSFDDQTQTNFQYVVLDVDEQVSGLSADSLAGLLRAENVLARRYFRPGCHRMEPYVSRNGAGRTLPVTESLSDRLLCLPTGTSVGTDEVHEICGVLRFAVAHGREIRGRMEQLDVNCRSGDG
jgi:dTDP-4-amino-4,6-dideoxygalactose transaminase